MLRRVAVVTDVTEEHIASIIRVTRIGELRTSAVTSNRSTLQSNTIAEVVPSSPIVTLMVEVIRSSNTSVLTRAIWRNIPEDGIFLSHRRENLKSYIALSGWAL
jgi:hypothetical protein